MRVRLVALIAFALTSFASSARSEVVAIAMETGGGVVISGEGILNIDAWSNPTEPTDDFGRINPSGDPSVNLVVGPSSNIPVDRYQDVENLTGASSFGTGGEVFADSGTGDIFGILFGDVPGLIVPRGYVSGTPLAGESVYVGETFESLGLDFGTYTWSWGSGGREERFALVVPASVPWVPSDLNPGDLYHVAFVTDGERDALSEDIADYNAFVQGEAEAPGAITENWGVWWHAIGSTSAIDARDNIDVDTAPVYLLSDVRLADDEADLWDGSIQADFEVTQFGTNLGEPGVEVWTGTEDDGTKFPTKGLGEGETRVGISSMPNSSWVSSSESSSNVVNAFYAVSEELVVVPEPSATGCGLAALATLAVLARRRCAV